MTSIDANEAGKQLSDLLDRVAGGERIAIAWRGQRILMALDSSCDASVPDYTSILYAPNANEADRWTWTWHGPEPGLAPTDPTPDDEYER